MPSTMTKTSLKRSTDFFTRQEQAITHCRQLLVLFIIAVVFIIIAIYFAFRLVIYINLSTNFIHVNKTSDPLGAFLWWNPSTFIAVFIVVSLFIFIISLIKMQQLQKGGGKFAETLGAGRVSPDTGEPELRQLLNIVEEMSIASGIPVPAVYVMDKESGINAFAAGWNINDAVIAVTGGALRSLNRDEMQGVVAHEFSHILYGDMRLNIRLIGIIYGILIFGIIGGEILEKRRISSKSVVLFIAALLLTIIGYVGTFAGRLIQSAVSRQKEFLADASAVKFTRNPLGLANALKKIGGCIFGSQIKSAAAAQASHLFFGQTRSSLLFSEMLSTHPPLAERILRLDPSFDGTFPAAGRAVQTPSIVHSEAVFAATDKTGPPPDKTAQISVNAPDIVNLVGNLTGDTLMQGRHILASMPEQIRQMLSNAGGAAALIFALLAERSCLEAESIIPSLPPSFIGPEGKDNFLHFCELVHALEDKQKLPAVELALPSLRELTAEEKNGFLGAIDQIIRSDHHMTLFEFSIQWIVRRYLKPQDKGKTQASHVTQVGYQILVILRALANAGNKGNAAGAQKAFHAGISRIPELASQSACTFYTEDINFTEFDTALSKLYQSSLGIKRLLVDACAHCAFADKTVTLAEAELLRVISLALQCPLPPFLPEDRQG